MMYIASDHGGFDYKERIKTYLIEKGIEVKDFGPEEHNPSDDYPDYAFPLAEAVAKDGGQGILLCRNAVGVCIAANKVDGIRAGIGYSVMAAQTMKEDDNTNIICLPADGMDFDQLLTVLDTWMTTEFSGEERHKRRLQKVSSYEEQN